MFSISIHRQCLIFSITLHKSTHRAATKFCSNLIDPQVSKSLYKKFRTNGIARAAQLHTQTKTQFHIAQTIQQSSPSMSSLVSKFESLSISAPSLNKEQAAYEAQWVSVLKTGQTENKLEDLNLFLRDNAFVTSANTPVQVDVELFEVVHPLMKQLTASSKDVKANYAKFRHVIRWCGYLQNLLQFSEEEKLVLPLDLELPREVIEKKKKEAPANQNAEAAAGAGKGKQQQPRGKPDEATLAKLREEAKAKKAAKKAAAAQQPKAAEEPAKISPSVIDFRVGFIQKAIKHPDADSLYVSTIDVGEEEGPRTVCSGLVKSYSLEEMQERYVVLVCNLKPVNMRGIKSTAMVLCGSDKSKSKVEFVNPPPGSKPGDKVFFEGYGSEEPLKQLNPKKKLWEQLQPHFSTNEKFEVVFKDEEDKEKPVRVLTNAKNESFKVTSIVDANVS